MDSFSGSTPRKFIPFCLGEVLTKDKTPNPPPDGIVTETVLTPALSVGVNETPVAQSEDITPTGSTDEELTAHIETFIATAKDPLGSPNNSPPSVGEKLCSSQLDKSQDSSPHFVTNRGSIVLQVSPHGSPSALPGIENNDEIPDIPFNVVAELLDSFHLQTRQQCSNSPEHTATGPTDVLSDPRLRNRAEQIVVPGTAAAPVKRPFHEVTGHDDTSETPADKRTSNFPKVSESENLLLPSTTRAFVPTHLPGVSAEDTTARDDGILSTETSEVGSMVEEAGKSSFTKDSVMAASEALNRMFSKTPGEYDSSGDESDLTGPKEKRPVETLSANTRSLIRDVFVENPPVHLPRGQPVVALSEGQLSSMIHAVSRETHHIAYNSMKDILTKAVGSRVLHERKSKPSDKFRIPPGRKTSSAADSGDDSELTDSSDGSSSHLVNTEDEQESLDYHKDLGKVPEEASLLVQAGIETHYSASPSQLPSPHSPGVESTSSGHLSQSLVQLRQEALEEVNLSLTAPNLCYQCRRKTRSRGVRPEKPNRILRDEHLSNIGWARIFVTGPMDPENNKYCFYCRICNKNISMYGKGASEIVRHYKRPKHLRRDQRWRYENLRQEDSVKGRTRHFVRSSTGKLLSESELERERKHFMKAELVVLGPTFPYFGDFISGRESTDNPAIEKLRVQLTVFSHYIPSCGDLRFLNKFWNQVGTVVNHQSSFLSYNWSPERLCVSICFVLSIFC